MSENTHQIQSLLDSVSNIIQKHETQANYTGENYNIFSIMGMENDEEFTHSRIIGNLLNPKGKHGCGDFFLKTFVEKLNILFEENNLHDMKLEDFGPLVNERITERYAGEVNCKTISGGSIDLVIEDSKQILLIENKIYAADQKYQLARYYNYAKTRGDKKIVMLYLTLDGKNLSDNEGNILIKEYEVYNIPSIVNLDENAIKVESSELKFPIDQKTFNEINIENKCFYTPISYKTFIKEWLEASFFFVDNRPMIYYPIKHYYNLIKKLTNQTTSKIMEKEIFENLRSSEANFKAFLSLNKIAEAFFMSIRNEIFEEIENKFIDSEFENFPQFIGDNYYKKNNPYKRWYGLAFKLKNENVVLVIGADKDSFNYGYFVSKTNIMSNNGLEHINNGNEEILNYEYCKKFFKNDLPLKKYGDSYFRREFNINLFNYSNDESVEFIQKEKVNTFANSVYNEIKNNIK
jgi:hypothetical protein